MLFVVLKNKSELDETSIHLSELLLNNWDVPPISHLCFIWIEVLKEEMV